MKEYNVVGVDKESAVKRIQNSFFHYLNEKDSTKKFQIYNITKNNVVYVLSHRDNVLRVAIPKNEDRIRNIMELRAKIKLEDIEKNAN